MNLHIATGKGEELTFQSQLPPDLLKYQVFPTVFIARGYWGAIIFQVLMKDEFSIWYSNYFIREDCSFLIESDISSIEFYVVVKNDFDFDVIGFERIHVKEGHFNMTYLPTVKMNAHFKPGDYFTFNVSFSSNYLKRFIPYLPDLQKLLLQVEAREFCHLIPRPAHASAEMKEVVNEILNHEYNDGLSHIYIESKIVELLTLSIRKISAENKKQPTLNTAGRKNVEKIKLWLDEHTDNPGSLKELANRFGMNEYKLRKDFREVYDTTVFDYLLENRLLKARNLIVGTDKQITEIAYLGGYSNPAHFTNAFKNRFGITPTDLRKNR